LPNNCHAQAAGRKDIRGTPARAAGRVGWPDHTRPANPPPSANWPWIFGLLEPLREFGKDHAIWGTCAGAIFLSKDARRDQPLLSIMDIIVQRNAFGRPG